MYERSIRVKILNSNEEYLRPAGAELSVSQRIMDDLRANPESRTSEIINGFPYQIFRNTVELSTRRQHGAFFTSPKLADEAIARLVAQVGIPDKVIDPCCGMGDLLLAYARLLPTEKSLLETIENWGQRLFGIELSRDLVETTKIRLLSLAKLRTGEIVANISACECFPNIRCADFFDALPDLKKTDAVLVNPPFQQARINRKVTWGSGRISMAAVFIDELLQNVRSDATVMAILPEVLRCGSRYTKFRSKVSALGFTGDFVSHGRFDEHADVDIFTTILRKKDCSSLWVSLNKRPSSLNVSDKLNVRIGCVVPHRTPDKGPWQKYICARSVPRSCSSFVSNKSIRFNGTVFMPPFVVVRRTSGPTDRRRVVPTVILGEKPVAVENHLIVLIPKDATNALDICFECYEVLASDTSQSFLNDEMRCRHLTKAAVEQIPWASDD